MMNGWMANTPFVVISMYFVEILYLLYISICSASWIAVTWSRSDLVSASECFWIGGRRPCFDALLQVLDVPTGEYLLQNGANSVLGKQLITITKKHGIKTINLVCTGKTSACSAGVFLQWVVCHALSVLQSHKILDLRIEYGPVTFKIFPRHFWHCYIHLV